MTEAKWLSCCDPQAMLEFLRDCRILTERKARLFVVTCCRRVWHLLVHEVSRDAVEVGERYADGEATNDELHSAHQTAEDVWYLLDDAFDNRRIKPDNEFAQAITTSGVHPEAAAEAAGTSIAAVEDPLYYFTAYLPAAVAVGWAKATGPMYDEQVYAEECAAQAELLREKCFNPFRPPPVIESRWLTWNENLVKRLAESIYQERDWLTGHLDKGRLMILADALEESGCSNTEVLQHLRGSGPHYRGCWCLDLLLQKE